MPIAPIDQPPVGVRIVYTWPNGYQEDARPVLTWLMLQGGHPVNPPMPLTVRFELGNELAANGVLEQLTRNGYEARLQTVCS